ncbi:MAG: DUF433 domain-containing protein [Deinococcota bacterium]
MTALRDIESKLASLTRAEKAQVLKWVAQDLEGAFSGIDKTHAMAGGDACIVRTRIPVWLLVQARQLGASEASLLENYPSLRAEDLTNAWAYARTYPAEIAQAIQANEDA